MSSAPKNQPLTPISTEDWRFHAIEQRGTGVVMIATTEAVDSQVVGFGLPSAPALYLSLASEALARRREADRQNLFVDHPQGIWPDNHSPLFDFFQAFTAEAVFSYSAIEAFANESIAKEFEYTMVRKGISTKLVGVQIERELTLEEKLKKVLPSVRGDKGPSGTRLWERYLTLKRTRDRIVHLKTIDRRASGPEDQSIWGHMLRSRTFNFPRLAYEVIGSYAALVDSRRWYREADSFIPKD
jgi:hypothetical protein